MYFFRLSRTALKQMNTVVIQKICVGRRNFRSFITSLIRGLLQVWNFRSTVPNPNIFRSEGYSAATTKPECLRLFEKVL